jgi:hypothetical protein
MIAFVAGEWTLAGMPTLVHDETLARCTSVITFVAGVHMLARMRTLVSREIAASCTLLDHVRASGSAGCSRQLCSVGHRFIRYARQYRQLSALGIGNGLIGIKALGLFAAHFDLIERCLDGEQNQLLSRAQIACVFCLELQPHAASQQLCSYAHGVADELRDCDLEDLVRN